MQYTVWCRYNAVNFLKNIHNRHPIARPLGRGMVCLLGIHHLSDILPEFLQSFMQYLAILDRVITALDCIGIQAHTLTLAILLATFCALEWRSNLKIDRVMVILRFDKLFDLVTYLFDL